MNLKLKGLIMEKKEFLKIEKNGTRTWISGEENNESAPIDATLKKRVYTLRHKDGSEETVIEEVFDDITNYQEGDQLFCYED